MKTVITICFIFICNLWFVLADKDLARGFNEDIDWKTLEDGQKIAAEKNMPMMILIHKSWCGACKALKPQFTTDLELVKVSKDFVMVNVMDDEEPKEREYSPDGGYIPRVLFANHKGVVQSHIKNDGGNRQYEYFYSNTKQVITSMKTALKQLSQHGGEL